MPHTEHKGNRHQHLHQTGIVVVVDVASIDRAMELWTMDPENLAVGSQLLGERKKGVTGPENSHHAGEDVASTFLSDAFRSNQQHNAIGDILKRFVLGDVTVSRPAQHDLPDDEYEKEECRQVERILRELQFLGSKLLSRPYKK